MPILRKHRDSHKWSNVSSTQENKKDFSKSMSPYNFGFVREITI
ncbi:hypothetical protein LEP1GSC021_2022 [Leptospira noguchii str. 1993005606]|uniref:Uncharacterized protein n=2 Tax=Leptospira noguchii TaxID=28182 RepID=M6Y034_9LEPT|nr:hypothetical protein LEP1GSC035_3645 [Leptospira noguchii str. 2007001578]EMO87035.1 hypothetical protein LEP1GSC024_0464 [Leptospira noguchii str. 2001034031]EMS87682.1 hypothetical protein LEP1GSC074_0183 [Leptospira noguchii str. Hook]EPE86465.1 hypothetical protein LEP1GSC021_2022 [Leptospira noguchii str. 1993005606]